MSGMFKRTYYRIRFPAKVGTHAEFYRSNSGTDQWEDIAKVKAILTRGMPWGYRRLKPFEDYEVVKITETVRQVSEIVTLPAIPIPA